MKERMQDSANDIDAERFWETVRAIPSIHRQAIDLWIWSKRRNPKCDPSGGIVFALTDLPILSAIPHPTNVVELCNVINIIKGSPPLLDVERKAISVAAMVVFEQAKRGGGTVNWALRLIWINRLGYAAGIAALLLSGWVWSITGLMIATWWAAGATRLCAQKHSAEEARRSEMLVHMLIHGVLLTSLYVVFAVRILLAYRGTGP